MSTPGWSRRGAGVLLAALICAVLAGSGFDSSASAQTVVDYDADDDGLIEVASEAQLNAAQAWSAPSASASSPISRSMKTQP